MTYRDLSDKTTAIAACHKADYGFAASNAANNDLTYPCDILSIERLATEGPHVMLEL